MRLIRRECGTELKALFKSRNALQTEGEDLSRYRIE